MEKGNIKRVKKLKRKLKEKEEKKSLELATEGKL